MMLRRGLAVWLAATALVLTSCGIVENEGRADEAKTTVARYLVAVGGGEADHGWSLLSESMRDARDQDAYMRFASAVVAPPSIDGIQLTYEDDGFYTFTVSHSDELDPALAEVLFTAEGAWTSPIACPNGPNQFEIAVIIGFDEFAGISGNECPGEAA